MKYALFFGVIFMLLALLTSCASTPSIVLVTNAFDAEEAALVFREGTGTISGSALIRQQGGGVVSCAGTTIMLLPATAYAAERIRALYGSTLGGIET